MTTTQERIVAKLASGFLEGTREVVNESHMHAVARGSETHFKVVIVSERFEGLPTLKRHRLVQGLLAEEIALIKAMSLHTFTPVEWESRSADGGPTSPTCAGARKANP
jgi:BolA protein